jgi:tryptophan synthase alpha chain
MTSAPSALESVIDAANRERRGALVAYLPVGFPDFETSVAAAIAVVKAGADVLELGMPYSDPVMDGPVIQAAAVQALEGGFRTEHVFEAIRRIRAEVDAPIVVMTYWNLVMQYGVDAFARDLAAAGGNGLITPDLVPDEGAEWIAAAKSHDLDRVFLAAPSSSDTRLDLVISTAEQVREVLEYAEGAIVGSALVKALAAGGVEAVAETAAQLARGTALEATTSKEHA